MSRKIDSIAYLIGAGSFTIGVEQAGATIHKVLETPGYSKNAQTWDLNRPNLKHEVLELDHTSEYFREFENSGLDMIFGNPPCGGVSAMTGSRMESPTNTCMRQWIRMVVKARPRMILMENGWQIAAEQMKPLLTDLTNVLDSYNYWWWTWRFYSHQISTPQIRQRAFLCASLDEPKNPQLMDLYDLPPNDKKYGPTKPYLEDLYGVEPSPEPVITRRGNLVTQHWYGIPDYAKRNELLAKHKDKLLKSYMTQKDYNRLKERADAGDELSAISLKRNMHRYWPDCPKEFQGMCFHRPTAVEEDKATGAIVGAYRYVHPVDNRFLTMREMARLMGYPDDWQFHELKPHLIAQGIPAQNAKWAADRMIKMVLGE